MAVVQCTKCTAERKGFRRELDSWRHRLVHCVGFECILEGIYGPMLLKDLNLFVDCEPEEVDDWSPEASRSQCSFCNLPLDKLSDPIPAATSPPSSPSDYSPCQALTICESSQSAHRFLQAVFHKKDVPTDCDSNIPLVAQELMKKMIHQFAVEYASKCLLRTSTNGVTGTSSPLSETPDAPLDLTVSRTLEEKEIEPEPDGALDLSYRNLASSAASSSNHKASGSRLPSVTEEMGDLGLRGTTFRQSSALDAVLRSLCPAHQSLLYQILKLAHQEKLLPFLHRRQLGQTESHCCHCGVSPQDNITPHSVTCSECKAHNPSLCCPSTDWDPQTLCSPAYHSGASKSSCSIHHHSFRGCNSEGQRGSNYSCVQRCRTESYNVLCSKRLHCISCQSQAVGHINNIVNSFVSAPLLSQSSLCSPSSRLCASVGCKQNGSCSCYPNHICLRPIKNPVEGCIGEGDCPVLNREQSPSPPPLSPIPSDINKKVDEKPPSLLHHRQVEEAELAGKSSPVSVSRMVTDVDAATGNEPQCKTPGSSRAQQNPGGSSLQEVVNRFSQKLEIITSLDKDPAPLSTANFASEKEQPQFPSTSQSLQCHADAHLTEIITTVLHTGSASDYSLSELFDKHDNREPKSPNTRSRRRKEVLVAIATRADDASTRRHTLQIKRDLAMFDQSYNRRKRSAAKKARLEDVSVVSVTSSDPDLNKAVSKRETEAGVEPVENHREGTPSKLTAEREGEKGKEEIQAVIVTEELQLVEGEERERERKKEPVLSSTQIHRVEQESGDGVQGSRHVQTQVESVTAAMTQYGSLCGEDFKGISVAFDKNLEEAPSVQSFSKDNTPGKDSHSAVREEQKCQSDHTGGVRRSTRSKVPPQWISSYVIDPGMFSAACFSESILNNTAQSNKALTSSMSHSLSKDSDADYAQPKSRHDARPASHQHKGKLAFESTQKEQCETSELRDQCQGQPQAVPIKEEGVKKLSPEKRIKGNCPPSRRLRSFSKTLQVSNIPKSPSNINFSIKPTCVENPSSCQIPYTSPIKLMFVCKEGVKYSLKSAGSSTHAEEPFDPCEESSWAGTPQKHKSQSNECATSQVRCVLSPPKSTSSRTRSTSSPAKLAASPGKLAASPRSASSSPKNGLRKSGDSTPSKYLSVTETRRSPSDLPSLNETTPPKRRPGRPKKLGPHLEQKAKRPIGRPRKQRAVDAVVEAKTSNGKCLLAPDVEDNVNKNLKITVLYGRSRRNKRMVSEGFDQLQTDFSDALQTVALKSDLSILLHRSKKSLASIKTAPEELRFGIPAMEPAPQSTSNIKCQRRDESTPSRKPGRPAKVKISGISVTVTTVSPRQRKIQINQETGQSPEIQLHKKALLSEVKSAKEPWTISRQLTGKRPRKEGRVETKNECKDELPNQSVPVRHSMRVRKPSIHFLHAVATSSFRSYSRSNALLRRSKQLLLTKESNERRQGEQRCSVDSSGEKRRLCGQVRASISQDLSKVAEASVESVFSPNKTLRGWAASAEEETLNQELARRIRVISDTWVADENQGKEMTFNTKLDNKVNSSLAAKSKHSSVVRMLFDCSPNKPRSCSMQQICSWFMQTTETQSLAIVKKASSRNPYELVHFPRSANKKSVCHSPQAERLRKHIKKFATTVPKSPLQHQQAQQQLRRKSKIRRQLFVPRCAGGKHRVLWQRCSSSGKYQATLVRARSRFLTRKERKRWQKKQWNKKKRKEAAGCLTGPVATGLQLSRKALHRSAKDRFSDGVEISSATCSADQTQELVDIHKEQKLCSKAWSPETLKECRVFLRKINSPDSESTEEEWDSCTVTLDDGSPSAYVFAGKERELVGVVKAVKSERKRSVSKGTASREQTGSAVKSVQKQDAVPEGRQKGKCKSPVVVSTDLPQPPPAKMLRQSRMRGLTGPRWCDFVFGN